MNNAKAKMLSNTIKSLSRSYTDIKSSINTQTSKEILNYIFYINIMNLDKSANSKLLVDVDSAMIDMKSSM